ncbi:hypothetical protein B484DRAFT_481846 [Ochromonadaceae sp. CCMP2298]|nr:hypothetical protein B484DRAFT_481846 [Ochromonadaceae sp. CCMP2298]
MVGDDVQVLRVVWMIRDCGELLFYLDYVYQLVKNQHHLGRHVVYVDVYLTGLGKSSDPAKMVSQMLFMLAASDKTSKYMNIHFGRPDMSRILKGVKPDNVYYCGGLGMQNVLAGICREEGAQFHPEDFDAGTAFVQGVERYFASWRRKTAAVQQKKKRMQRKQSMLVPELPTTAAVPDKA